MTAAPLFPTRAPHRRTPSTPPALVALCLLGAVAVGWPLLLAAPLVGGPLTALAVGVAGWRLASAAAPLPHANDNAVRPASPVRRRRDRNVPQRSGARVMFGGNGKTEQRAPGRLSVIGADVTVTGNIATQGDLHIDGAVEGDIACGSLIQGASGRIVGGVVATSARIAGTIEGRVSAASLVIEKTARVHGDADYQTLQIENGAQVDGRITHLAAAGTAATESPLRLVDASDASG